MEESETRPTYIEQRRKPKPLSENGYWIAARRHPEKGYVEAWRWVEGVGLPEHLAPPGVEGPLLKDRPVSPSTHAGHSAKAMEDAEDRREANMRDAMGLPPED
jgi:hypothetical protein